MQAERGVGCADARARGGAVPGAGPRWRCRLRCPMRAPCAAWASTPGVTLIVGGGFHGKTTLLKALEAGVYDKVLSILPFMPFADISKSGNHARISLREVGRER